ncbi:MAG: adenylate/guanylate cyclase domain-containing protein [Cyanothece sp. SIO1E1]|nr:adenylate/guanylate cyclase domain-containing protein [Cyanothece sp. SIO1E1]
MRQQLKQRFWQWRGIAWITPGIGTLVLLLRFSGLLQAWEWSAFDQYMRLRPQLPVDDRIVIVGIDEADVERLGQGIISDQVYAEVIEKLKAQQPRAIGLDIYRNLPVEPGHAELVQVFESTPNLVGVQKVVGDAGREAVGPSPTLQAQGRVGSNDLIIDPDDKIRRGLVYVNTPAGDTIFSFGFYLALLYLAEEGIKPETLEADRWRLGHATFLPFAANDGGYVRSDAGGYQLLLNYRGPSQSFEIVSLTDVLTDQLPSAWGRDRVILIGGVGESFQDLWSTPYSSTLLSLPKRISGVELHAHFISQIISAAMEGRPLLQTWSEPVEWLWIFVWSGIGTLLVWQFRRPEKGYQPQLHKLGLVSFTISTLLGSTYIAFVWGWWIPLVPALVAFAGSGIAVTAYLAQSAGNIRKTFGRYLSDEIVANLLDSPEGLSLGGERRKVTILTSDLRGFTAISEQLPPEAVVKILNLYLGHMTDVITHYQGTIDEFMGDGILVFFGVPTARPDDAQRAIACAVAMQLAMAAVNQTLKQWNLFEIEMGIGINTGEAVVGNIGSEKRTKYGAVGSEINLTYRIESNTTGGQILVSESTLAAAGSIVMVQAQREIKLKGIQKPVPIYHIVGIEGVYNLSLPEEKEIFLPLAAAIPIQYAVLAGKQVGDSSFSGYLTQLSAKGALMQADISSPLSDIAPATNIKLSCLTTIGASDIYAKVLDQPAQPGHFYIRFTAKSPAIATQLEQLYQSLPG